MDPIYQGRKVHDINPLDIVWSEATHIRGVVSDLVARIARNIQAKGQQFPVVVRETDTVGKYRLVAGLQRLLAVRQLNGAGGEQRPIYAVVLGAEEPFPTFQSDVAYRMIEVDPA